MRILREAEGMRERGHTLFFAVTRGGKLVEKARESGFYVYEIPFKKPFALLTLMLLLWILLRHKIELVNTHSSWDAWIAGVAARMLNKKIIRTRHLSTVIRPGLNSRVLYKGLADFVVTTSSQVAALIQKQADLNPSRCKSIPTGVDPALLSVLPEEVERFRKSIGVKELEYLVGSACIVRSWKGIRDLLQAAALLKERKDIKWVIVGGGYLESHIKIRDALGLQESVTFTGHLDSPYAAIAAMDVFTLLSTAHEGVSQASLQAAFLQRPLLTTPIGGLPEVCIEGVTGMLVPPSSPEKVADAVSKLLANPQLRHTLGQNGRQLVKDKFTFLFTLNQMEEIYKLKF
jgi:glycosyltransferase involved in cell wall biosynthesis